jgi:RNA 2',3'-cyclic 3'-phosphodiesterase
MTAPQPDGAAERLRLFVALELPRSGSEPLTAWTRASFGGVADLRILDAELLHVTLAFLGWREAPAVDRIEELLRPLAGRPAPSLAPSETVVLPRRRPRVVALDLADAGDRAARLQADTAELLTGAGLYEAERRSFRPHLTVARVPKRGAVLPTRLPDPPSLRFDATAVVLYRSDLGPAGARYSALARAPLLEDG